MYISKSLQLHEKTTEKHLVILLARHLLIFITIMLFIQGKSIHSLSVHIRTFQILYFINYLYIFNHHMK